MEQRFAVACDNDAENHGQECHVHLTAFFLAGDEEGEDGGEKRCRCADGLVEGDWEVSEGGVAANDGEAEDGAEREDLEELFLGVDVLGRYEVEEVDGCVAVGGAG